MRDIIPLNGENFISPDDTAYLDPEFPNGLNLYCYCGNDPVNYADPRGHLATLTAVLMGLVIAVVVSLAFAIEYFLRTGNWQGIPEKIFAPA